MQLIAFDLDGTLCNTIEDIAGSLNRSLQKHGIDPYPLPVVQNMVGRSVAYMCQRAMPHGRENDWKPVMDGVICRIWEVSARDTRYTDLRS